MRWPYRLVFFVLAIFAGWPFTGSLNLTVSFTARRPLIVTFPSADRSLVMTFASGWATSWSACCYFHSSTTDVISFWRCRFLVRLWMDAYVDFKFLLRGFRQPRSLNSLLPEGDLNWRWDTVAEENTQIPRITNFCFAGFEHAKAFLVWSPITSSWHFHKKQNQVQHHICLAVFFTVKHTPIVFC